ncbi:hypothetical protein COU58_02910 [Candidatus Pacearchaeota archaeon CG10_big_fil_rev_8_21_14_0_10_32_42]|nr:MAG: hypothetical protein COU58_02910 [Candidatus Pacearchaeota archaeon CG10_big_fil_rev_8_21_14_0_10_32_42]
MIEGLISLASYGIVGGGTVGNFLYQLETMGVFSYVLPFLMIFALIYAILSKSGFLGKNNAVNVVLSLAVSLMALQFNFVSYFFAEIFPRMGVMLSILLVAIILMSLFLDFNSKGAKWGFGVLAAIGIVVIVLQSFSESFGWGGGSLFDGPFWWMLQDNFAAIAIGVLVVGAIIAIPLLGNKNPGATH